MGPLQDQNLTQGLTQADVAHRESTAHQSLAVNTVVVLGVLTFGLQLCLVLFLVYRCQRLDNKIRDALKEPKTVSKGSDLSSLHRNIYKQVNYQQCNKYSSSSAFVSVATDQYISSNSLFGPSIPWDLVQR